MKEQDIARVIFRALVAVGIINFVAFFVIALSIGGDAMNGKIANGHFFLASHGKLTEVSEGVYMYSLWHARSVFITQPLAMISIELVGPSPGHLKVA
jgi:hypothetical protein